MSPRLYSPDNLAGARLRRSYDIAPPEVKRHLEAETNHVLKFVSPGQTVLELGCGYGRFLDRLLEFGVNAVGIDISLESLRLARTTTRTSRRELGAMNAAQLAFSDESFDLTVCIQNGISAFRVNKHELLREAVRVTRHGGTCLFSTYTESFWMHRLKWFEAQAREGLIEGIDYRHTCDGVIRCRDGFRATTFSRESLLKLAVSLGLHAEVQDVGDSCRFLEIAVTHAGT